MFFMAVHATGREEAKYVHGGLSSYGRINRIGEGRVASERAILNGFVDSGDALVNNTPGSKTHMSDFRVSHLARGQSNIKSRPRNMRRFTRFPEAVKGRCSGMENGVIFGRLPITESIQNNEDGR
jgi:hypothetical protein